MTFGELLNEHLMLQDRHTSWLADRLHVHASTVGRWLSDESRPRDLATVIRIADLLSVHDAGQRRQLMQAAGFVYVALAPDAEDTDAATPASAGAQSTAGRVTHPLSEPRGARFVEQLRGYLAWDAAPEHMRLSWAGMTVYTLGRLAQVITVAHVLIFLTATLLWIVTGWLLRPILDWPLADLVKRRDACWLYAAGSLALPLLVATLTRPDGYTQFALVSLRQRMTLWLLKITGAYVGFAGFSGIAVAVAIIAYLLGGITLGDSIRWGLALLPLVFSHIGARRIPLDRFLMYGGLRAHEADRFFLPVYVAFGPSLALFIYFCYPWLTQPYIGFATLVAFILLLWWEQRATQSRSSNR